MRAQKHTAQEWSDQVRDLLKKVQEDGHSVWIGGHPELAEGSLYIGVDGWNPAFEECEEEEA